MSHKISHTLLSKTTTDDEMGNTYGGNIVIGVDRTAQADMKYEQDRCIIGMKGVEDACIACIYARFGHTHWLQLWIEQLPVNRNRALTLS